MLEDSLASAWKGEGTVGYGAPSRADLDAMEGVFVRLLRGVRGAALAREALALGWSVRTERRGAVAWTVVAELRDRRGGRGLYAFADRGRHALQAPHVPSDKLTGQILLEYASDGLPRALAWNTVTRGRADLAHLDGTYLIAFSRAFARVFPAEKIVQLHGFDAGRRRTTEAADSAAIVSAARRDPPAELKSATRCMRCKVHPQTRLYGVDVLELGGTTNSVAAALRAAGYGGFVHLEMDLPLRQALAGDAGKRRALLACVGGSK
ncbi:hypothetical protein [Massilia glaciei]|uniref:hypothetical protein n=1 Tax=Massilia glaciei TaxID=1524097 RepID=UPI0015E82418|nr:hypothetical protein [Massilia glaciei]